MLDDWKKVGIFISLKQLDKEVEAWWNNGASAYCLADNNCFSFVSKISKTVKTHQSVWMRVEEENTNEVKHAKSHSLAILMSFSPEI